MHTFNTDIRHSTVEPVDTFHAAFTFLGRCNRCFHLYLTLHTRRGPAQGRQSTSIQFLHPMVGRLKGELSRRRPGTDDYISSQKRIYYSRSRGYPHEQKRDRVYLEQLFIATKKLNIEYT